MSTVAYVAINKSEEIRQKSSSGAVFYEVVEWVIDQGGVVFGVTFDNHWNAVHTHTESLEGATAFLGSKYVQSSVGNEYQKVKEFLDSDRIVLFSGTPCQVSGLRAFLGKAYDKLLTVDFVCHGVPSPVVWQKYLKWISHGRTIERISFRDKTEGWLKFSLRIDFSEGGSHRQTLKEDLYMKGFLQNIYLRPSCYECRFKGIEREADITLADFWGIQQDIPQMFDDKGTSLVLIHSEIGRKLWGEVVTAFKSCEVQYQAALKFNSAAMESVCRPAKRSDFYQAGIGNFNKLKKLTRKPLKQRMIQKSKAVAKKIIGKK